METAHAIGKELVLSSDAETLTVSNANELYYDARNRKTVVHGESEIVVLKDAHELYARKLMIQETKAGQEMTATGPGRMGLFDKATKKRSVTASWKDTLISTKDNGVDFLTLIGDASFQDLEHDQILNADELKVWLEPSGTEKVAAASPVGQNAGSRRPQRVEATRHVVTRSPEMYIHDTDKLILVFKDALPAAPPKGGSVPSNPTTPLVRPGPGTPASPGAKPEPAKPARPIDLSATRVEARVLRLEGGKNELDRLWTEGEVIVHQAPEKPDEKGLDIKGDTLELIKQTEGNRVIVTGDVAELQIDKLFIRGPQIEIDQAVNEAWVKGVGALTMRNKTSFNGTQLDHEVDMTIYWSQYMHFQGAHADFTGSIQAEQENARLSCQKMLQVDLDKPISFREGQKNGPPAKVDRMVCDMKVVVRDEEYKDGKYIKSTQIECTTLTVDNTEGKAYGSGPGRVRIHQRGDAGSPLAPAASAQPGRATTASKQKEEEFKLTIVNFGGRMWANDKSHTAIFSDDIKVINLATDNPELEPDENRLPRDAVYLQCSQRLDVRNRPENGKSNQELEATGNILCRTAAYLGQCEKLTYNEGKDQLIFDGVDGLAHLKKLEARGLVGQTWDAKLITYNRKTDTVKSEGARGINGVTGP
jgi:lipopolysaccharide export system protein LptA